MISIQPSPPPRHTTVYDQIRRGDVQATKAETLRKIGDMTNVQQQAFLFSKLIEIKYYRQNGPFSNVEAEEKQEACWEAIQTKVTLPSDLKLVDLMAFIKNDDYIFRSKIPQEFKDMLAMLNDAQKETVLMQFNKRVRQTMVDYLNDATGENWNVLSCKENGPKPYEITHREFKQKSQNLKDQRWLDIVNEYPSFFMVTGNLHKASVDQKITAFNELDFENYVVTRGEAYTENNSGSYRYHFKEYRCKPYFSLDGVNSRWEKSDLSFSIYAANEAFKAKLNENNR